MTVEGFEIHPVTACYPMMYGEEFAELVQDIRDHGLQSPITVKGNVLLDGRNRLLACQEAGVEPRFVEYAGDNSSAFIVSTNVRRNLSTSQRAMVAARISNMERGRPELNVPIGTFVSMEDAASALDVSRRTVARAKFVDAADPDLGEAVLRGELSVNKAVSVIKERNQEPIEDLPEAEENDDGAEEEFPPGCVNCRHCFQVDDNWLCKVLEDWANIYGDSCPCKLELWVSRESEAEEIEPGPSPEPSKPHVANNSGDNEWYTPEYILEAARAVLGQIDLDPASSECANSAVKASKFYTSSDDGLIQPWSGKVWMNPPYAAGLVGKFISKLASEVDSGNVSEGVVLVNNATETAWFKTLASISSVLCFHSGRVKYLKPGGSGFDESHPLQGQCIAYIGNNGDAFKSKFIGIGVLAEVVK
jgi:phage N-6-adenine-methyltransferase